MNTIAMLLRHSAIDAVDARVLLRTTLGVSDAHLIAHASDALAADHAEKFAALVARRAAGEPVAYLVGEREFYGRTFAVSPAVLIPRPETELLVELTLERLPRNEAKRVLDLGTGSGCIAISIALERHTAQLTATDKSAAALTLARQNAQQLGARNVAFKTGDWFDALHEDRGEKYDLIVSNPPYVAEGDAHLAQGDLRFEPASALSASLDGYACLNAIVDGARAHLNRGAWLLMEHGHDQAAGCRDRLRAAGYGEVQSWRDLAGIERVSGGTFDDTRPVPVN